jgi:hypothetical protein
MNKRANLRIYGIEGIPKCRLKAKKIFNEIMAKKYVRGKYGIQVWEAFKIQNRHEHKSTSPMPYYT